MTIHADRVDAWHIGALFMLLEIATIYAGEMYGVNPLDQLVERHDGVVTLHVAELALEGRRGDHQAGVEVAERGCLVVGHRVVAEDGPPTAPEPTGEPGQAGVMPDVLEGVDGRATRGSHAWMEYA